MTLILNSFIKYIALFYNINYKLKALKKPRLNIPSNIKRTRTNYIAKDIID
jgi:hypothetical protein